MLTVILRVRRYTQGLLPSCRTPASSRPITTAGPTALLRRDGAPPARPGPQKILQDKDVASLSSFIGVDGTNTTINSGRFLINLKDKGDRDGVTDVMDRLAADAHAVPGITFYLQPVQDLTIDSTVSRAEYQFILQSATHRQPGPVRAQADRPAAEIGGAAQCFGPIISTRGFSAFL